MNSVEKILLIGAGALARDIVEIMGCDIFAGVYVDPEYSTQSLAGLEVISNWQRAKEIATHYILGIADIPHRERVRKIALRHGLLPASPLISPTAQLARDAVVSPGCVIGHFVVIGPMASVGEDVFVMHSAIVAHNTEIRDNTVICPGVWLGGYARIGKRCFVGANATLIPKLKIADDCHIAAGAACFKDAPENSFLAGNPARKIVQSRTTAKEVPTQADT